MDTYKTILTPSDEILFKEKNSKFYGYAFPVTSENEVKEHLTRLRKQHYGAGHFCYAYQIGIEKVSFRANDDGEPANSAGMPIYGQLQSFDVTNVLVVVVRFFGGVKLGVGGLMASYKTAAQMALASSGIIEKTIELIYILSFDYKNLNKVMRVIRENNLTIVSQRMAMDCEVVIAVRKSHAAKAKTAFDSLFEVRISVQH